MSASRLLTLLGASIIRNPRHRHRSTTVLLLSSKPPVTKFTLISSPSVNFSRHISSAAAFEVSSTTVSATGDDVETSANSVDHPWPEWTAFVDNLKSKGYFTRKSASPEEADDGAVSDDLNSLKAACLSFARDRFDIFKSLSKEDIQAVVDKGCPNIFRKAVNSAKRLRVYLQLKEADVCNACVLRGSCDRAFYILKDFEASARTVDIVRVLMLYALDPLVTSGSVKTPSREVIEESARKLLSELTDLSETERDPDLINLDTEVLLRKQQSVSENTEMKRGDWMCPKCNFLNFARNLRCRKCAEDGPKRVGGNDIEMKKGDWLCPKCNFMNFAKNIRCLQCKTEGPKRVSFDADERRPGDWDCPKCGFMNYASNVKCKRCQDPRKKGRPGEW